VDVIAELLGVPTADRSLLRPWSNAIVKMYEYDPPHAQQVAAEQAAAAFVAYLRDLVAQRRAAPRTDDLVTDLVQASDGSDRLSEDEVVGTCVLLLMAGHEATVNVVGNGLNALLRQRDQWARVVEQGDLVVSCAEEMLRHDSSLQLFERTATQDVVVAGTRVRAGQKIAALLGAANRDPAVFRDPDAFDAARAPNPHLAFGAGIHFCLGAPLARVEIQSVVSALRSTLPHVKLAEEPGRRPEFVIRGLQRLDVTSP
jgi:cytochrome P450